MIVIAQFRAGAEISFEFPVNSLQQYNVKTE